MPMVGGRKLRSPDEHRKVENHREDQVHDRSGEHDDDPLPQRLRFEGALAVLGEDGIGLGLFQHLDEAAERDERRRNTPSPCRASRRILGPKPSENVMTLTPKTFAQA